MKENLLRLIDQLDDVEKLFHKSAPTIKGAMPAIEIIYDVPKFKIWQKAVKLELMEIYGRDKDEFIKDTISDVSKNFNGWRDRDDFNTLKGDLLAIRDNIDNYYSQIGEQEQRYIGDTMVQKQPKIFISHSSLDAEQVEKLVELLRSIGLREDQIFCSSVSGYDIPLGKNIFDDILRQFQDYKLHVIFVLSKNFYESPVCLNEMGAAWVLSSDSNFLLLPGFDFSDIRGVIDRDNIGIKLAGDNRDVRNSLNQLKDNLIAEFNLPAINSVLWEDKRNQFISDILEVENHVNKQLIDKEVISNEAKEILSNAIVDSDAQIFVMADLTSGKTIEAGNKSYSEAMGVREFSKWESGFDELLENKFIKDMGNKNEIFKVTKTGFDYFDNNINKKG